MSHNIYKGRGGRIKNNTKTTLLWILLFIILVGLATGLYYLKKWQISTDASDINAAASIVQSFTDYSNKQLSTI